MNSSAWTMLEGLLGRDAASPRVTFYERTPGPTAGERVELSTKVLVNWVSKAANLLIEEFDVAPGDRIGIVLPAAHWRTTYWCLAAWSVGAAVTFVDSDAAGAASPAPDAALSAAQECAGSVDVLVTCLPVSPHAGDQVVVSLPMLARQASGPVPAGAIDEAKELSTFGDVFDPLEEADPDDVALEPEGVSFAELTSGPAASTGRTFLPKPTPQRVVRALAAGGAVVMVRGDVDEADLARILAQESATPA